MMSEILQPSYAYGFSETKREQPLSPFLRGVIEASGQSAGEVVRGIKPLWTQAYLRWVCVQYQRAVEATRPSHVLSPDLGTGYEGYLAGLPPTEVVRRIADLGVQNQRTARLLGENPKHQLDVLEGKCVDLKEVTRLSAIHGANIAQLRVVKYESGTERVCQDYRDATIQVADRHFFNIQSVGGTLWERTSLSRRPTPSLAQLAVKLGTHGLNDEQILGYHWMKNLGNIGHPAVRAVLV